MATGPGHRIRARFVVLSACILAVGMTSIGPAEAAVALCGSVITANTTLRSDIGPCSGDGIVIGANDITLDLNGHEVFGTPGPGGGFHAGIRLPSRTGVSIVGARAGRAPSGTVRDFDAGVFINGGGGNKVRNLVVRDNIGPLDADSLLGDGIILIKSARNIISGNVVKNNGRFDGIGVLGLGSDDNTIEGNTVEDNIGIPEGAIEVGPGEIPHHINAPGHGIIVSHFYDQPIGTDAAISGNNLRGNTVRRNDGSGISTVANFNAVISGNVVEDNARQYYGNFHRLYEPYAPSSIIGIGVTTGDGLRTRGVPSNVLVRDNFVNRNAIVGIHIGSAGNQVLDNHVSDNGSWGINVDYEATSNSIIGNRTDGNLMVDLLDQNDDNCADNRWWRNTYSAELGPLGVEFGFPAPYYPDCTAAGPPHQPTRPRPAPTAMPHRALDNGHVGIGTPVRFCHLPGHGCPGTPP